MKKILFSGLVAVSLVALAATPAPKKSTKDCTNFVVNDTVPGKKDTLKKPIPDSIYLQRP